MIKAVIFDMDGLLIDSEPLWREAEIQVFAEVGVPLDHELCLRTTGIRIDQVVLYWYERFPWKGRSLDSVADGIVSNVRDRIATAGCPKPGSRHALELVAAKTSRIGLASGSYPEVIDAVLDKLGIRSFFQVVHSAKFERVGKPAPDVYLSAAAKLGTAPSDCLAFEDSISGLQSAKAAGMKCVCVPEPGLDPAAFGPADLLLGSLLEFSEGHWNALNDPASSSQQPLPKPRD